MPKIVGTVTQGSNDAYAESGIVTQLSTLSRVAWVIDHVMIERSTRLPGVDAANIEVALSRGTKTAMPLVSDRDVLFKVKNAISFTTSGATLQDLVQHFTPEQEILIVEETIYLQVDSASTTAAATISLSIEVHAKTISEAQRLSILAGRIAS